jgi:hypothetical protein
MPGPSRKGATNCNITERNVEMAKITKTAEALETAGESTAEAAAANAEQAQKARVELKDAKDKAAIDSLYEDEAGHPIQAAAASEPKAGLPTTYEQIDEDDADFGDIDGNIGYGSFPIVKLQNGKLVMGEGGEEVESFKCVLLGLKKRWLYKSDSTDDAEIFYSYDKLTDTSGRTVEARLAEWESEGFDKDKFECKEYAEVMAQIVEGSLSNKITLLSVPPASIKRLAGLKAEIKYIHKTSLKKVITKVSVGKSIKVGSKSFNPWQFDFDSKVA